MQIADQHRKIEGQWLHDALLRRGFSILQAYGSSCQNLNLQLLINQYETEIERYTKTEGDSWLFRAYESDADKIMFASINIEITVEDIYENVNFKLGDTEK